MATNSLELLADLIARARAAGADAADAVLISGTSLGVQRRLGQTEHVERSEGRDLGLRVFLGRRAAIVSSSAIDPASFTELAERAVAMARVVPEDPYAGLADTAAPPESVPLDLEDPIEPDTEALLSVALPSPRRPRSRCRESPIPKALRLDIGRAEAYLVTSAGFAGRHVRTSHSISASALAGAGTGMQRDYDYHSTVHLADLDDPAIIGRSAGERAVARLNPDPAADRETARRLRSARRWEPARASGRSDQRRIRGARHDVPEGQASAPVSSPRESTIHDDPRRVRGLRSRAFDGEGTPTMPRGIIAAGVLTTWLLDSRSARQLGLRSTGHASRGTGGPPSPGPTNLYLDAGELTPAELMADIKLGLYVNEMIGMGVNGITGDYSRGAAGFMIRDGALAEPVAEITIAGNLLDMFAHLTPANDLRFRRGTDAPTVRVDGMTMAGA